MDERDLAKKAMEARKNAYAPYSHFRVGAALLAKDGSCFTGCNIENISYGATVCAERVAVFKAVSEGVTEFDAIAIAGGNESEEEAFSDYAYPCGMCRQVLAQFGEKDMKVLVVRSLTDIKSFTLGQLLPESFEAHKPV